MPIYGLITYARMACNRSVVRSHSQVCKRTAVLSHENHKMTAMKMTRATQGFLFTQRAYGYSQTNIDFQNYVLTTLTCFLNDPEVHTIQAADLTHYFGYLRTEYIPNRKNGSNNPRVVQLLDEQEVIALLDAAEYTRTDCVISFNRISTQRQRYFYASNAIRPFQSGNGAELR